MTVDVKNSKYYIQQEKYQHEMDLKLNKKKHLNFYDYATAPPDHKIF